MALIHQTIRAEYIPAFLERGHYFIKCSNFRDKEEFRYGYCLWNCPDMAEDELRKRIEQTHHNPTINQWIDSTGISCWVSELKDEEKMWREHGMGGSAIRISIDETAFLNRVHAEGHQTAAGRVTYAGMISYVRPQFRFCWNLGEAANEIYHLFFDKRGCFEWEAEFRVVVFAKAGLFIPRSPDIQFVIGSPLSPLDPNTIQSLRDTFAERFFETPADFKEHQQRVLSVGGFSAKDVTPKKARLLARLEELQAEEKLDGLGWNDPKAPPEKVQRMLARGKEMHLVRRQIAALEQQT